MPTYTYTREVEGAGYNTDDVFDPVTGKVTDSVGKRIRDNAISGINFCLKFEGLAFELYTGTVLNSTQKTDIQSEIDAYKAA